ncbi:MAG: chemotaxis protein CheW [Bdellovibrionales bacterium]|nr:chemotaxis protein CheW [Bdellovibrionales bacterium]
MSLTTAKPGQFLTFKLLKEFYGVAIENIREINRVAEITPVPKTPHYIKGVMNLRGKIIPVVNLRARFGLPAEEYTRDTCIIVIDTPVGLVGLIVDSVKEVVTLDEKVIEPPPHLNQDSDSSFVTGMGKLEDKVLILVDVVAAFTQDQILGLAQVSNSEAA